MENFTVNAKEQETNEQEQQKPKPKTRGSRVKGGAIAICGARNFTGDDLTVSKNEVFDDIINRGSRVASLSRKLGISDKSSVVREVIGQLFENDARKEQVMNALSLKQGKKVGIFEAMTTKEIEVSYF